MKRWFCSISACVFGIAILAGMPASAVTISPVGTWETVSDVTGEVTSIVVLEMVDGELVGKIKKLFRKEGDDPDPVCDACSGTKKDQPVQGLTILWGLTRDGSEWNGGMVLDPENGKSYRCVIHVSDDDKRMEVRGYIGFALFGRTQVWNRREAN